MPEEKEENTDHWNDCRGNLSAASAGGDSGVDFKAPDEELEEGEISSNDDKTKKAQIHEERLKILAHFQALSGQEQTEQRETWSKELQTLEQEIGELKIQLSAQVNRRNHLRLVLGLDMIKKVAKKSMDHLAKEVRDLIKNAKGDQQQPHQSERVLPTSIENNNAKLE